MTAANEDQKYQKYLRDLNECGEPIFLSPATQQRLLEGGSIEVEIDEGLTIIVYSNKTELITLQEAHRRIDGRTEQQVDWGEDLPEWHEE